MRAILSGFLLGLAILPLTLARDKPADAIDAQALAAAIQSRGAPTDGAGRPGAAAAVLVSIAIERYRADGCAGDYVCDEGGAWETAEAVPVSGSPANRHR